MYFHTKKYGHNRKIYNNNMLKDRFEIDYYEKLEDDIELQYYNKQNKLLLLLKCY